MVEAKTDKQTSKHLDINRVKIPVLCSKLRPHTYPPSPKPMGLCAMRAVLESTQSRSLQILESLDNAERGLSSLAF